MIKLRFYLLAIFFVLHVYASGQTPEQSCAKLLIENGNINSDTLLNYFDGLEVFLVESLTNNKWKYVTAEAADGPIAYYLPALTDSSFNPLLVYRKKDAVVTYLNWSFNRVELKPCIINSLKEKGFFIYDVENQKESVTIQMMKDRGKVRVSIVENMRKAKLPGSIEVVLQSIL